MPSGVFIKENFASSIFKRVFFQTRQDNHKLYTGSNIMYSFFFLLCDEIFGHNEKGYPILILELTINFAPLRPAGFVNFCRAG